MSRQLHKAHESDPWDADCGSMSRSYKGSLRITLLRSPYFTVTSSFHFLLDFLVHFLSFSLHCRRVGQRESSLLSPPRPLLSAPSGHTRGMMRYIYCSIPTRPARSFAAAGRGSQSPSRARNGQPLGSTRNFMAKRYVVALLVLWIVDAHASGVRTAGCS